MVGISLFTKEEKLLIDNSLFEKLPIILEAQNNAPQSTLKTRSERE